MGALRDLVATFTGSGSAVRLRSAGEVPLDPRRSGILVRIAAEAVLNAVRHADAASIEVTLGGPAILRIRDDGRGLIPRTRAGVGLASMREWADEAGFEVRWEQPAEGGTLVVIAERPPVAAATRSAGAR